MYPAQPGMPALPDSHLSVDCKYLSISCRCSIFHFSRVLSAILRCFALYLCIVDDLSVRPSSILRRQVYKYKVIIQCPTHVLQNYTELNPGDGVSVTQVLADAIYKLVT